MKNCKLAFGLTIIDWFICLIAFIIQWVYADNDHIYFMSVDLSWAIRVIIFSLVIMLILNSDEDMKRLSQLNKLVAKLFIFQFVIYYIDFLKNYLAYTEALELWKELFIIKFILHFIVLFLFASRLDKLDKEIAYITN